MGLTQLSDHVVQKIFNLEQMLHWDMLNKATKFECSLLNHLLSRLVILYHVFAPYLALTILPATGPWWVRDHTSSELGSSRVTPNLTRALVV